MCTIGRDHCDTHDCTLNEIKEIKEENMRIRAELQKLKDAMHSFEEFEDLVIERYRNNHPIRSKFFKLFEKKDKKGKQE